MGGGGVGEMVVGSDFPLAIPIHALITVGNVEEKVLFMMLLGKQVRKTQCYDVKYMNAYDFTTNTNKTNMII